MGIQSIYYHHDRGELSDLSSANRSEFAELAAVGTYCLDRSHKCAAVLLAKAEIDRRHTRDNTAAAGRLEPWRDLLARAESGDEQHVRHEEAARLLDALTHGLPA